MSCSIPMTSLVGCCMFYPNHFSQMATLHANHLSHNANLHSVSLRTYAKPYPEFETTGSQRFYSATPGMIVYCLTAGLTFSGGWQGPVNRITSAEVCCQSSRGPWYSSGAPLCTIRIVAIPAPASCQCARTSHSSCVHHKHGNAVADGRTVTHARVCLQ